MRSFFCMFFLIGALFSALPPLAQDIRERQALLSDQHLYEALGSRERIVDIVRVEDGFLVLTQHYALRVDLRYTKGEDGRVGPASFELDFQEPVALKESRF